MKPLLVGEDNPFRSKPELALYPLPLGCAGHRLQVILGLTRSQYLRRFDRVNLCEGGVWDPVGAQVRASQIIAGPWRVVVLLGRKVARAFERVGLPGVEPGRSFQTIDYGERTFVLLPHPSGRCRAWNEEGASSLARRLVEAVTR